jgi:hypothetical protein
MGSPPPRVEEEHSYAVGVFDHAAHWSPIASGLAREAALELARREAASRGLGRMFLTGSDAPRDVVAIRGPDETPKS